MQSPNDRRTIMSYTHVHTASITYTHTHTRMYVYEKSARFRSCCSTKECVRAFRSFPFSSSLCPTYLVLVPPDVSVYRLDELVEMWVPAQVPPALYVRTACWALVFVPANVLLHAIVAEPVSRAKVTKQARAARASETIRCL